MKSNTEKLKNMVRGSRQYKERDEIFTRDFSHAGVTAIRMAQILNIMTKDGELVMTGPGSWQRAVDRKFMHMRWRKTTPPEIYGSPTWHRDNSGS